LKFDLAFWRQNVAADLVVVGIDGAVELLFIRVHEYAGGWFLWHLFNTDELLRVHPIVAAC
jgi:hypothetical protein